MLAPAMILLLTRPTPKTPGPSDDVEGLIQSADSFRRPYISRGQFRDALAATMTDKVMVRTP